MSVSIHVNGRSNSLAHKGCSGITKSTIPDVCKTPSPGGPVPIPYPVIVSMSSSLKNGSTTVKVDGGNPAAIKGSEYGSCSGDEPGSAGGVKSSTNMKEATWILYSFDVKIEGKNACRLSDKMMMNHGNSACLGGTLHAPVPVITEGCDEAMLQKLADDCNKAVNCCPEDGGTCPTPPKGEACKTLGTKKHKCCEKALKNYAKTENGKKCGMQSEVGFPEEASDDARNKAAQEYETKKKEYMQTMSAKDAKARLQKEKVYMNAYYEAGGAKFRADVLQGTPPDASAWDFKFNCGKKGKMSRKQRDNYKTYTGAEVAVVFSKGDACNCPAK
jgi:hypothetical protein